MRYATAASLVALFATLERLGVRPEAVADPSVVALARRRPAGRVPAGLVVDLLERGAAALGDPLFGLRHGQLLDPRIFGPVSLLWRYAPSIRYSNRITVRVLHLQHEGVSIGMRDLDAETSAVIYRVAGDAGSADRQFIESGVSFLLVVCRLIMGAGWAPLQVNFAHAPGADAARYAEILRAPVMFGAAENGLVVSTADLDRRSPDYDAEILGFVERSLLHSAEREKLPFRARLEQAVDDMLAIGTPRLGAVAGAMAVSNRTLQRHLAAEGLTFREMLRARRRRIIGAWPARAPLALLAERTGFSEASAVSRFLRREREEGLLF